MPLRLRRVLSLAFLLAVVVLPVQRLHAAPRSTSSVPSLVRPAISVISQIYLGSFNGYGPYNIAVDAGRNRAYAVLFYPNRLWVLDTSTNQQVISLSTDGLLPTDVAVNPHTGLAYITNHESTYISVLNEATNAWLPPINIGVTSEGIAIQPERNRAYVTTYGKTVLVVDLTSGSVLKTIRDPSFNLTKDVAVDPGRSRVYVENDGGTSISVINANTNRVINSVNTGHGSSAVAVDPVTRQVYVASYDGTVSVVNTAHDADTLVATISVSSGSSNVAVNPVLHRAYVTNYNANTVSEIDTQHNTVIATIQVGNDPEGIAVDLANNREFVASFYADYVTVLGE